MEEVPSQRALTIDKGTRGARCRRFMWRKKGPSFRVWFAWGYDMRILCIISPSPLLSSPPHLSSPRLSSSLTSYSSPLPPHTPTLHTPPHRPPLTVPPQPPHPLLPSPPLSSPLPPLSHSCSPSSLSSHSPTPPHPPPSRSPPPHPPLTFRVSAFEEVLRLRLCRVPWAVLGSFCLSEGQPLQWK